MVRRGSHGDLTHHFISRCVEDLHGVGTGHCEVEPLAVRADVERAGRLVQRHAADLDLFDEINDDECHSALLLGSDVGGASVRADGAVMRLCYGNTSDYAIRRGIDDHGLVATEARHEYFASISRNRQAMRRRSNLYVSHNTVHRG